MVQNNKLHEELDVFRFLLFQKLLFFHLLLCCLLGLLQHPSHRPQHRSIIISPNLPFSSNGHPRTKKNAIPVTTANSLQAAILNTMAFKLSLEINSKKLTPSTKGHSSKSFITSVKSKIKMFLSSNSLGSTWTDPKLQYAKLTLTLFSSSIPHSQARILSEACDAFNATMLELGYSQKLQPYNPTRHQAQPPQKHPFYG